MSLAFLLVVSTPSIDIIVVRFVDLLSKVLSHLISWRRVICYSPTGM